MPIGSISSKGGRAPARRPSRCNSCWRASGSGERCLYVTLSESERELRAVVTRHGWTLDGIDVFELVPPEASLDPDQELTLFHPAEMELSETTKSILDRVRGDKSETRRVRLAVRDAAACRKTRCAIVGRYSP